MRERWTAVGVLMVVAATELLALSIGFRRQIVYGRHGRYDAMPVEGGYAIVDRKDPTFELWRFERGRPDAISSDGRRVVWVRPWTFDEDAPVEGNSLEIWGPEGLIRAYDFENLCPEPDLIIDRFLTIGDRRGWCADFVAEKDQFRVITWRRTGSEIIWFRYEDGAITKRQLLETWIEEEAPVRADQDKACRTQWLAARAEADKLFGLEGEALDAQIQKVSEMARPLVWRADVWGTRAMTLFGAIDLAKGRGRKAFGLLNRKLTVGLDLHKAVTEQRRMVATREMARFAWKHLQSQPSERISREFVMIDLGRLVETVAKAGPNPEMRRLYVAILEVRLGRTASLKELIPGVRGW